MAVGVNVVEQRFARCEAVQRHLMDALRAVDLLKECFEGPMWTMRRGCLNDILADMEKLDREFDEFYDDTIKDAATDPRSRQTRA